jgi:hypothetical protein
LAANQRDRAAALAQVGVTPPEYALFNAVHYGITVSPASLLAAAEAEDYNPSGPVVTEEQCRLALAACLAKGWLQIIDETALANIIDELRRGRFFGPIYGLPPVGGVDFTAAGAALWQLLCRRCFPEDQLPFAYIDVVHSKTARYFRNRAAALAAMQEARGQEGVVSVTGPNPVGPWRVQWWRRFPDGYCIDIEERGQWQGRCGVGGSWFMPSVPRDKADLPRLRRILDCHNVSFTQWLLLAAMEHGRHYSAACLLGRAAGHFR